MEKASLVFGMLILGLAACGPVSQGDLMASSYPSPTQTPTPDITSSPTFVATSSPTSTTREILQQLDVPDWLKDPGRNVLMYSTVDSPGNIFFLEPQTGDKFTVDTPVETPYVFLWWQDSYHAVFTDSPQIQYRIDIENGTLTELYSQDPEYSQFDPPIFSDLDYDWRIETNEQTGRPTVFFVDKNTGAEHTFDNDGYQMGYLIPSPNRQIIAIMQTNTSILDDGEQISIYSLATHDRLMAVEDEGISMYMWFFPDNDRLLYMRTDSNIPCIIYITEQKRKCIHAIPQKYPREDIYIRGITNDSQQLLFLHGLALAYASTGEPINGGMCSYDLFTGAMNCPMDGLEILQKNYVVDFSISPDSRYIIFLYDSDCPVCEVSSDNRLAVIGVDGNHLSLLGQAYYGTGFIGYSALWRPVP